MAPTVELVALQVVPSAVDADLDDVARELLVLSLELGQLAVGADATPVGLAQPVPIDVGDESEALVVADRTHPVDPFAEVAPRPEQLGMGIADIGPVTTPGVKLAQRGPAGECVIDVPAHRASVGSPRGRAGPTRSPLA